MEHLLASAAELRKGGVAFFVTDRGGDITYHGPGQLIVYPVLDLKDGRKDVHVYLRNLESCIMATLRHFGIVAGRLPGATGVWVGEEKIAAIGVRMSQWITSHGLALNVHTDLNYFNLIVPCGLHSKGVTSMFKILGSPVRITEVKYRFCQKFEEIFVRQLVTAPTGQVRQLALTGMARLQPDQT
jgi:lipoate-protein ligase B